MNYTLHKDIPVPLYYQLKLQILADIREGRLKVGDMIQPECDLCRQLGVSRPTVRQGNVCGAARYAPGGRAVLSGLAELS